MKEKLIENLFKYLFEYDNVNLSKEKQLGSDNIGKFVLLRGYDSGVHFGKLEHAERGRYILSDSRRLWRFWAKKSVSLSGVAVYGLADRSEVKICPTIPKIEIRDERVSEIIPCSDEAIESIKNYKEAEQS